MRDRWALPGPAGFLEGLGKLLRQGESVVVGCPHSVASSLGGILENYVRDQSWRVSGPIHTAGAAPVDELFDALELDEGRGSRRSVASLLGHLTTTCVIIVSGVEKRFWPSWQRFLVEFENSSRAVPVVDRPLILLIAEGIPKNGLLPRAVAMRSVAWDGVIGEADTFSYVIQATRAKGRPIDAQQKLVARIITRLALWDLELAERLLAVPPRDLFNPVNVIRSATDGMEAYGQLGTTWEEGGLAEFDGERMTHPVVLARQSDPQGELQMRLWAAQAAEVMPALELNRRWLAQRMKGGRLRLPVLLNGETITDLDDIELGPLLHLARSNRLPSDIVRLATKFRDLRNKLAHLKPLSADEAFDNELLLLKRH